MIQELPPHFEIWSLGTSNKRVGVPMEQHEGMQCFLVIFFTSHLHFICVEFRAHSKEQTPQRHASETISDRVFKFY